MYTYKCFFYFQLATELLLIQIAFILHGGIVAALTLEEKLIPLERNVKDIIFQYNGLSGTIPSLIGDFADLTNFDLRVNNINGTIPTQIGKLEKLTFFSLENNKLSGNFPTQIGHLTNLEILSFGFNGLKGHIPTEIGNLKLTHFDVESNKQLSGTIPTEIVNLADTLRMLFLQDNKLTGQLPIQLSYLPRVFAFFLGGNDFDLNCEDEFLEWYIPLSELIVDKYDLSLQCLNRVYPFQLRADSRDRNEPSQSIDSNSMGILSGSRNATFRWTHPNVTKLQDFAYNPSLQHGTTETSFQECRNYLDEHSRKREDNVLHKLVGFEVTVFKQDDESGNSIVDIRKCIKKDDLNENGNNGFFEYTLDFLLPATEYEVTVRAFNLNQEGFFGNVGMHYKFLYGPSSKFFPFKTKDDVPDSAPINLRSSSAREDQIDLAWDNTRALVANGEIVEYEVHSINDNKVFLKNIRQVSIPGLEPNTEYSFRVRARTSVGGFSKMYSKTVKTRTCPREMKRNDETNCFAIQGSFAVSATEALVCEVTIPDIVAGCETQEELTVQTLDILSGFWRPDLNHYTDIRKCPVPEYCTKERSNHDATTKAQVLMNISGTTETEPEAKQCSLLHRGVYCSACDDGYVLSGSGGCIDCTDRLKSTHEGNYLLFVIFLSSAVLLCILYVLFRVYMTSFTICSSAGDGLLWRTVAGTWNFVAVKLRILEGFLQVIFVFQSVLYVDAAKNVLVDIDLGSIANLNFGLLAYGLEVECAVNVNHYLSLLLYTIPPVVIGLLLSALYYFLVKCRDTWKKKLIKECFSMFFIVSFLIYPGASKAIFDTFLCEEFETVHKDTKYIFKSALRADYRLSCSISADGRIGWLVYAALMVLVFPVGILTTYVYFLRSYSLSNVDESTSLVKDLIYPYKRNRYWYEAYELVRKLLQTTFVSFCLIFGIKVAASVALNLSITALLALVYLNPYKNFTDFGFAVMSLSVLVFSTQLEYWFDTSDCDQECRTERTGEAIGWIIVFELFAALFFVGLDKCFPPADSSNAIYIVDQSGFEKEMERLQGENGDIKEENLALQEEIKRLRSEMTGYKQTFA